MKRLALLLVALAGPASAYDLSKATAGAPEAVIAGSADFYATERCIVMLDGIGAPAVYRTPDRPDESLIYYPIGGGHPIVYRLDRKPGGVSVTISTE